MKLKDSVIIVSGGSQGIGLETALQLQAKGAKVVVCARNVSRLQEVASNHGLDAMSCNVANEDDARCFVEEVVKKYGRLDALINNAAYGYFGMLEDIESDEFERLLSVNVIGAMHMAREVVPVFKKQNYGNIVNIASTAGLKGFAGGTAYAASKFALRGMSECWRDELRKHNVRVTLINPSEVQTPFAVNAGYEPREFNESKLVAEDIAHAVCSVLEMDDRGFVTELTVFATNPK